MARTYKDTSFFDDVKDVKQKAWNRMQAITNLQDQGRDADAEGYWKSLSTEDLVEIAKLLVDIEEIGVDKVRAKINRGLNETISYS